MSNHITVTEIYRSLLGAASSDPTWVRVFDVSTTPGALLAGTPPPELPKFGDVFPDDTTMYVDQIDIMERRAPEITRVGVAYRRTSWEGWNRVRTDTHPDGPWIEDNFTTTGEAVSVPRIVKITDNASSQFLEFQQYTQTIYRPSTTMTRTLHLSSYDLSVQATIDGQIDWIHGDLVPEPGKARFLGAQVTRIGNRLWRVDYQWSIKRAMPPIISPGLTIPGGEFTASLLSVTNSQNPTGNPADPIPGSFPAHSVPLIMIPQRLDVGAFALGQDPIYYPDRIFQFEGTFAALPGLEAV